MVSRLGSIQTEPLSFWSRFLDDLGGDLECDIGPPTHNRFCSYLHDGEMDTSWRFCWAEHISSWWSFAWWHGREISKGGRNPNGKHLLVIDLSSSHIVVISIDCVIILNDYSPCMAKMCSCISETLFHCIIEMEFIPWSTIDKATHHFHYDNRK